MPICLFEQFESKLLPPLLSAGSAPVLEGGTMYFVKARVNGESKAYGPRDIIRVPRGAGSGLVLSNSDFAPYALVQSTAWLENKLAAMMPGERADARVGRKAN